MTNRRRPVEVAIPIAIAVAVAVALSACARAPSTRLAGSAPSPAACVGTTAEPITGDASRARTLRLAGGHLYWTPGPEGHWMSRMDLGTSTVEHRKGSYLELATMDARQSFWTTNVNDLMVVDFATMKVTTLVSGRDRMEDPIVWSSLGLDDTYLYYGRDRYPPLHEAGLFRMRRDGTGQEERIASQPALDSPFVVAAGFAYWFGAHQDAAALLRRALRPGTPEQRVARLPTYEPKAPMKVLGDRVLFADRGAFWSVPADGSGPATKQLEIGNAKIGNLLVAPPCFYFVSDGRLKRAALDANPAQTPVTLADDRTFDGGDVVTDGRFLYWIDPARGRIMRAAPGGDRIVARDELVATPSAAQSPRPLRPSMLALAEGWGCVYRHGENPELGSWSCWKAAGPPGAGTLPATITAQPSAKLLGFQVKATRDRVCRVVGSRPMCWRWDELMDGNPADVAERGTERPTLQFHPGGTFSCVLDAQTWVCSGDNRYGQLANGGAGPEPNQPGIKYHADYGLVGDWHGCHGRNHAGIYCWGRDDVGQLGYPGPDVCKVGAGKVPCSTKPRKVTFADERLILLGAGDMFTCAWDKGLTCWGGSRDGAFGTAGECPAELRRAWPTLTGTVAAPNATCSRTPVELRGFPKPKQEGGVVYAGGARGICAITEGTLACAGAIPAPRLPDKATHMSVHAGELPAACASTERDVFCWGAGYSPPNDPAAPVRIVFEAETRQAAPVVDTPPKTKAGWRPDCGVHFSCPIEAKPLPTCSDASGATVWSEFGGQARRRVNQTVRIRGPLVIGPTTRDDGCNMGERCCDGYHYRSIAIGGSEDKLLLDGLGCGGDGSRLCCNRPAYGQQVVATGKLTDADGRWTLKAPEVCLADGNPR